MVMRGKKLQQNPNRYQKSEFNAEFYSVEKISRKFTKNVMYRQLWQKVIKVEKFKFSIKWLEKLLLVDLFAKLCIFFTAILIFTTFLGTLLQVLWNFEDKCTQKGFKKFNCIKEKCLWFSFCHHRRVVVANISSFMEALSSLTIKVHSERLH